MAKKPPAAAAEATAINLALLHSVVSATAANSFVHVSDADAAPLLAAGYIVQNPTVVDGAGAKGTKSTPEGDKFAAANVAPAAAGSTAAAAPAAAAKPSFAIVDDFEMPASRRTGPSRGEAYPFGDLKVGQAFFIPATADKPNPERSYASTVTSAKDRYAVEVAGQTRVNRKGRTVPVVTQERDFQIRRVEDGAAFGHPGVAGAAVKRTK